MPTTNNMPDLNAPVADLSGAQLTPEILTAARVALDNARRRELVQWALSGEAFATARWGDGDTQFVRDDTVPSGRVYFAQTPFNLNSMASRIVNDADRLTWSELAAPLTNGEPLTPATCHRCGERGPCAPRPCNAKECHSAVCIDLCVGCMGYNRAPVGVTPRLEYRAYGDGDGSGPVLEGMQCCERCGVVGPCSRVNVAEYRPTSWSQAVLDPTTLPTFRPAYYCYDCAMEIF